VAALHRRTRFTSASHLALFQISRRCAMPVPCGLFLAWPCIDAARTDFLGAPERQVAPRWPRRAHVRNKHQPALSGYHPAGGGPRHGWKHIHSLPHILWKYILLLRTRSPPRSIFNGRQRGKDANIQTARWTCDAPICTVRIMRPQADLPQGMRTSRQPVPCNHSRDSGHSSVSSVI